MNDIKDPTAEPNCEADPQKNIQDPPSDRNMVEMHNLI